MFRNAAVFLLGMVAAMAPVFVHAQTVVLAPDKEAYVQGETIQLDIRIETGQEPINAADGTIQIADGLEVVGISTAGSLFTLWPVVPKNAAGSHTISFAGGTPGGLKTNTTGRLFTVTLRATKDGTYPVASHTVTFYKNDGLGTPVAVRDASQNLSVSVSNTTSPSNESTGLPAPAPEFAYATVGQDQSLFNGAWYLSFSANGNGNIQYMVREGLFSAYVPTGQYYVLKDQSRSSFIVVKARDAQGQTTTTVLWPHHVPRPVSIALIVLVLLALCTYGMFKIKL